MTLTELQDKLDKDLVIDPSNLMGETADNLRKHSWWIRQMQTERLKFKKSQSDLLVTMKDRYNFYAGYSDTPYEYNLDSRAIKYNLEGDQQVIRSQSLSAMQQARVEICEKACDLMVSRSFAIKNQIELLKFYQGE